MGSFDDRIRHMEIKMLANKSILLKGKKESVLINPSDKIREQNTYQSRIFLFTSEKYDGMGLSGDKVLIRAPGEYEVGGVEINGYNGGEDNTMYVLYIDKIKVVILGDLKEELVDRLLVRQGLIDAWKLKTGQLSSGDFDSLSEAMGVLADAPLYIDDTPGLTVTELRTKARRLQIDKGIKFIIVDYLQLMHGSTRDNRVQEVAEISQGLKNLARELKIPVLALAQLSRAMEARGGRPRLSDLRESGSIEQDADVVFFLYREDEEVREMVTCSIEKHRNGPTGSFNLYFNGKQVSFFDVENKQ